MSFPNFQEFIIHSPDFDAHKIYIGNALNGDYAAVFAQLYLGGQKKGKACSYLNNQIVDGKPQYQGLVSPILNVHNFTLLYTYTIYSVYDILVLVTCSQLGVP